MTEKTLATRIANEEGIALVLSLFLTMVMSIVAASLMLLAQTETYSSMNYRLMSQARYGAEAGIETSANYLMYNYQPPAPTGPDPIASYNLGVSPVTLVSNNLPVILSANSAVLSNYPVAAVQTAFLAAASGSLASGNTTVSYAPYATLISMKQLIVYGGGPPQTLQTWQITSDGSITAARTAQVEVTAVLEQQPTAVTMYGAFATGGGCGALQFSGSAVVNSYNSAALVGGIPVIQASGGNVGTNGNMGESGNATIDGSLSSPRVGVGACSAGNVDALSSGGHATITGGVVHLPQAVVLTPPVVPVGVPTTAYVVTVAPLLDGTSVGNVSVPANGTLTLGAVGTTSHINMNSLSVGSNANVVILGTVILNVVGAGTANPINLTAGSVTNAGYDASTFQIQYAGTDTVSMGGNAATTAMLFAPNAAVTLGGTADFYGSIVGASVLDTGNAGVHYDTHLSSQFFQVGNFMLSSFSWKKS